MAQLDSIVFGDKTFSDILEEIYSNQKEKQRQVLGLIEQLKPLIQDDIGDATLLVPLIKEYLDVSVKNDEQLIKMANIVQRVLQNDSSSDSELMLTEDERDQLLQEIDKIQDSKKEKNE